MFGTQSEFSDVQLTLLDNTHVPLRKAERLGNDLDFPYSTKVGMLSLQWKQAQGPLKKIIMIISQTYQQYGG